VCLLIAVPAVAAIADNVQVNDMAAGANVTKTPGETGTASVRIIANSAPNGDRANCNLSSRSPATVSLSASPNKITFDSTAQITSCKNAGTKPIGHMVSPTAQPGDVITVSTTTTDSNANTLYNEGSFTVTVVAPPNNAPVANDVPVSTAEDTAVTITLSGTDADGDNLTFDFTQPANGQLGPLVLIGPTTANVTYTPKADFNGTDSFTYTVSDGNGGTDTADVTITVISVNDPPSFTKGGDVTVNEDSGAYSAAWATAISAGPADEAGQTVSFQVSNDNNALFSTQPSVAPNGTLSYTPADNANGTATVSVTLHDDGGTANGGDDTSDTKTFTITVNPVNDAPNFTKGADPTRSWRYSSLPGPPFGRAPSG
jgi:Bacterial Ig domain